MRLFFCDNLSSLQNNKLVASNADAVLSWSNCVPARLQTHLQQKKINFFPPNNNNKMNDYDRKGKIK